MWCAKMPSFPSMKMMKKNLIKWLDRIAERMQMWLRRYDMPVLVQQKLMEEDCNVLQALTESPAWERLMLVRDNVNWERNQRAIGFCDGRSFVEFKKMEGVVEYLETIEEIVKLHKTKTTPAPQPTERPRKISEYVPR